jgi:hypothetical protein
MFLFGCLLAFGIAMAPRLVLVLAWIFGRRWDLVWQGNWIVPLLGIIFLPYTTVMYLLVWSAAGISGFDWVWLGLGLLLDIMKWSQIAHNRQGIPGYPQGATSGAQQPAYATPVRASQPVTEVAPETPVSAEAELAKLAELRDQGILTEEEYQAKKAQLGEA